MSDGKLIPVRAVEAGFQLIREVDAIVETLRGELRTQILDATRGIGNDERLMAHAKKPGAIAAIADGDKVGQRAVRFADFLGDDGAEAGIDKSTHAFFVAGVQIILGPAMRPFARAHAPHDGAMIHEIG